MSGVRSTRMHLDRVATSVGKSTLPVPTYMHYVMSAETPILSIFWPFPPKSQHCTLFAHIHGYAHISNPFSSCSLSSTNQASHIGGSIDVHACYARSIAHRCSFRYARCRWSVCDRSSVACSA